MRNSVNMTGAQVARRILDSNGLYNVPVEATKGELTDHYDPRKRALFLSEGVYGTPSIATMGIAAHEVGHALQHAQAYAPLQLRSAIVPAVNIGSSLGLIVLIAGIVLQFTTLAWVGVALFCYVGAAFANAAAWLLTDVPDALEPSEGGSPASGDGASSRAAGSGAP